MSDRDSIIAKVKKCLALAMSANEHEAAAALRQAQKLMEIHGITDADVAEADIEDAVARGVKAGNPARWETLLALSVRDAFGCETIFKPWHGWIFIGFSPAPEISQYAFEVLFRQVRRARQDHIKTRLKRCGPVSKTRRADLFCEGWVITAAGALSALATSETQTVAIAGYIERRFYTQKCNPTNRNAGRSLTERDMGDYAAGASAGRGARINRGVGESQASLALE